MLKDSIHRLDALSFFTFCKNYTAFFANGDVFEQDLAQKFTHLYTMIVNDKVKRQDTLDFLKSIYVSEMQQLRGDSYAWLALETIFEGEALKQFTFQEAVQEIKRVHSVLMSELINAFPDEFATENAELVSRYSKIKAQLMKYSEAIANNKKASLEDLHGYFFAELKYINLNAGEKDSFELSYVKNFTKWHQSLGFKSAQNLKDISTFEFFSKNAAKRKRHERKY